MAMFHNYDPLRVVGSFRGIPWLGYFAGSFIKAVRTEAIFSTSVGAGGDVTRVRSRDRSGTVTLLTQAESPTNDLLSAVVQEDELFGTGFGPLMIKDLNGTTLLLSTFAWVQQWPEYEAADDASGREWSFGCAELEKFIGGGVLI